MGLFELLLLVLAGGLAGSRHYVRIDAAKWAHAEVAAPEVIASDEHVWSWSSDCAPSTADGCERGAIVRVKVIDAKRRPAPQTRVLWATAKMAAEIPDALLPASTTDDAGVAELVAPLSEPLFARAAGPKFASDWQDARRMPVVAAGSAVDVVVEALDENGKRARRARASVMPLDTPAGGRPKIAAAADDGTIHLLLAKSGVFRATFWSDELAPAQRTAMAAALAGPIRLHPGAIVRGVIRSKKGALAGARVQLTFAAGDDGTSGIRRQTRSAEDGRFEIRGVPPGKTIFTVAQDAYASLRRDLDLAAGLSDLGRIELSPARSVHLFVVDAARAKPIAGATVRAPNGERATTAANGVAILDRLGGDDEFDVDVTADSYLPSRTRLRLDAKMPAVPLTRGATVRATVVARDTRTAVGAGDVWIDLSGTKMVHPYDDSGRIQLTGLAAGTLELEIRSPGFAAQKIARREIQAGELVDLGRIELDRGRAIVGTIVDATTGEPLPFAHIRAPRPNISGPRLALVMNDWIAASADENGNFRVGSIPPGDYRLLVESSGHAPLLTSNITVTGDDDVAAGTLKLAAAHRLKIACTPARRCGGAVELLLGDANDDWAALRAPLADGEGSLIPAPEGEHLLRLLDRNAVVAEKSVTVTSGSETQEVRISIPENEVRGVVTRGGRPAAGGSVQFIARSASKAIPVFIERRLDDTAVSSDVVGTLSRHVVVPVDASGNFVTTELGSGDYDVIYSGGSGESPAQRVAIPDVGSYSFRLDIAAAGLSGTVRDERGRVPEWARVELQAPSTSAATDVAPDGSFTMDGVPPGRVTLRAYNDSAEAVRELVLEDGRAATADLVLHERPKAEVRGKVISAEGIQVAGATVFFLCDGALKSATSDARGIAEVSLAASRATCSGAAFASDRGWAFAPPVSISASSSRDAAEVPIRFAARAVTISLASGRSAAVGVITPTGFPLERAFPFVGWPSGVSASAPLQLRGMPPGSYFVTLSSGVSRSLSVDGTKDVAISF